MLEMLLAHHARLRACLVVHRALCSDPAPQSGRLALSTLRIAAANADRTRFLTREVLPTLQTRAHPACDDLIDRLAVDLATRQAAAKAHGARWDVAAIEEDWAGYQAASTLELASIEERIGLEVDLLVPLL